MNQRHLDVRIAAPREYAAWESELRERVRAHVGARAGRRDDRAHRRWRHAAGTAWRCARSWRAPTSTRRAQLGRRLRLPGEVALADVLRLPELFEVLERPPDSGAGAAGPAPGARRGAARVHRERGREGRAPPARHAAARRDARRARRVGSAATCRSSQRALRRRMRGARWRASRRGSTSIRHGSRRSWRRSRTARRDRGAGAAREPSGGARDGAARPRAGRASGSSSCSRRYCASSTRPGAKAADVQTERLVLEAKGEVEKLREQVQNVE